VAAHNRVEAVLTAVVGPSHYVLAVWEMEAWLLLFPAAMSKVAGTWAVPARYHGRDTGHFSDPKELLRNDCCRGTRRYQEGDAPDVLRYAVDGGHLDGPQGSNRSWDRFRHAALLCCATHLPRR
jgi:hypothetical protein